MLLRILDTKLRAKGMKNISKLQHVLVPSLLQRGPLYVFILIAPDRVVLFLNGILKWIPNGCSWKQWGRTFILLLTVGFPPVLDVGDDIDKKKVSCPSWKNHEQKNILLANLTIYLRRLHLFCSQIWECQSLLVPKKEWRLQSGSWMWMHHRWATVERSGQSYPS